MAATILERIKAARAANHVRRVPVEGLGEVIVRKVPAVDYVGFLHWLAGSPTPSDLDAAAMLIALSLGTEEGFEIERLIDETGIVHVAPAHLDDLKALPITTFRTLSDAAKALNQHKRPFKRTAESDAEADVEAGADEEVAAGTSGN